MGHPRKTIRRTGENRLPAGILFAVAAVRANLVPLVVLWGFAGALVLGYYFVPGVAALLQPLATWQQEWGWVASFLNRFVFCGVIPGAFVLSMKRLSLRFPLTAVCVQTLWSGVCGIVSGWMFCLHAEWFGTGIDLWTLTVKTAVQQFVWTPLFFAPVGALVYHWIGHAFVLDCWREPLTLAFWREIFLPNLLANWMIWIPCAVLIHMFPIPLQIQLAGFVNAFFCLIMLWIGKGNRK